jgi:hypothetical protein
MTVRLHSIVICHPDQAADIHRGIWKTYLSSFPYISKCNALFFNGGRMYGPPHHHRDKPRITRDDEDEFAPPVWVQRLSQKTAPVVDWLGARRPLDLIGGACLGIMIVTAITQQL